MQQKIEELMTRVGNLSGKRVLRYVLVVLMIAGLLIGCEGRVKSASEKNHELQVACLSGGGTWDTTSKSCTTKADGTEELQLEIDAVRRETEEAQQQMRREAEEAQQQAAKDRCEAAGGRWFSVLYSPCSSSRVKQNHGESRRDFRERKKQIDCIGSKYFLC